MIDLARLLDIQDHDTTATQIRHRRDALAERDELVALATELTHLTAATADADQRRADLNRQENRFEDEAQLIHDKVTSEHERMYSGEITVPKELQAIDAEIVSLKRRQTELEDEALLLMELIEPIDAELADLAHKTASVEANTATTTANLCAAEAAADDELARVEAERGVLAEEIDAELMATYEKVRAAQQGIAVSRLVGSTCDGCHLGLSAVELDRVKHESADVLLFHEECGRILVR